MNSKKLARAALCCIALLFWSAGAYQAAIAAPNPDYVNALWVAKSDGVSKVSTDTGGILLEMAVAPKVRVIAVDDQRGVFWAYGKGVLRAYDFRGQTLRTVYVRPPHEEEEDDEDEKEDEEDEEDASQVALGINGKNGSVWLGLGTRLHHYSQQGELLSNSGLDTPVRALAVDQARGQVWVATRKILAAYDDAAKPVKAIPLPRDSKIKDISVDASASEIWVAFKDDLRRYDVTSGHQVFQRRFNGVAHIASAGGGGLWVTTNRELVRLDAFGVAQFPPRRFSGQERIRFIVADPAHNAAWVAAKKHLAQIGPQGQVRHRLAFKRKLRALAVYADRIPPVLTRTAPASGSFLNRNTPTLSFSHSDIGIGVNPDSLAVSSLGVGNTFSPLAVNCAHAPAKSTCVPSGALAEGYHSLFATIRDYVGNLSQPATVSFTVDTVPPVITVESPAQGLVTTQSVLTLQGRLSESAFLYVNGHEVALDPSHRFTAEVTLTPGENTITLSATDRAGNAGRYSSKVTLQQQNTTPDPAAVAPPVDPTVATPLASASEFLYTGNNPIQKGVAAGTIVPKRVAVLRGQVFARGASTGERAPLAGVKVTILGQPNYGHTQTRGDGLFDMAVNGGGLVTVQYEKPGYLPAQRQVNAPWQDYAWADPLVMIPLDPQVTRIDLATQTSIEVAQGSVQTDADGSRRATLLFSPGTRASMTLPDGSTQALSSLQVRATEYTVGANGPDAMPAPLPPTSAYTYAVEFSVDEAIAAGARTVTFSQPVHTYVENFLNFPVGGIVPAGYYDLGKAQWIPSKNGRVIKVLSISAGLAALDTNGDNLADNPAELAALDISDAERAKLATLYQPGQSLWRVPVTHFTPWDYNWPFGPPADARPPQQPEPTADDKLDDPSCQDGSIIECENQTLRERLPIVGTPFTLNYGSDRVPGRKIAYTLAIPVSGASLPASLSRIELEIFIAGRQFTHILTAAPNQTHTFTWDGKDAYGRPVAGQQPTIARIGYVYPAVYQQPAAFAQSFALTSGIPITGSSARQEITLWQTQKTMLGTMDARKQGLGGWGLDIQHVYTPGGQVLYSGDGTQRQASGVGSIITTVAGNGKSGYSADGIPAVQEGVSPEAITVAGDGSIYIADEINNRIRRVRPDGIIDTVAGNGEYGYSGDGGLAVQASLRAPTGVAVAADGSLYIADNQNQRIRRVGLNGIIATVAGNGTSEYSGDGGPASQAGLSSPMWIALAADGSVYIADDRNNRIRRIGLDGIISTVAGNGTPEFSGDGGPAVQAGLPAPRAMAVAADGSLYIADTWNRRIRRVGLDGMITTVAGRGGWGYSGDGGPAVQADVGHPMGVVVAADGSMYITGNYWYQSHYSSIHRVGSNGVITTLVGYGISGYSGDGGPALQAGLSGPSNMAVASDGSLYIIDSGNQRIRRIGPPMPGFTGGDIAIPSEDGRELYQFNASGRHLRTLNALTRAVRYAFTYNSNNLLSAVTDGDGNVTRIERAGAVPTALIAPDGQRTALTLDGNGYLASVANPAGEATRMTYTADGLLTRFSDGNGHASVLQYDAMGRLLNNTNAAGGGWTLARSEFQNGYTASLASALGRTTSYRVEHLGTGDRVRSTTGPDGTVTTALKKTDGSTLTTAADGTVTTEVLGPDPRFGMQAPLTQSLEIKSPSGLTSTLASTRTVRLSDPNDPLSLQSLTDSVTVNGRVSIQTYTAATRTLSRTSPAGRTTVSTLDAQGRPIRQQIPGLAEVSYAYDPRGRLIRITQGSSTDARTSSLSYDAQGQVDAITDALNRTQRFTRDAVGRPNQVSSSDGRVTHLSYDQNGNVTALTPPARPAHGFAWTPVDLESEYSPPILPGLGAVATRFAYNLDKQATAIARPDGQGIHFRYDAGGRLDQLASGAGTPAQTSVQTSFAYLPVTGQLSQIGTGQGVTLGYRYDGSLPVSEAWSGPVTGTVARAYDPDLRVNSLAVNGTAMAFGYDADSLLTSAGALGLTRDAQNGLLTGTVLGGLTTTLAYTGFGEVSQSSASHSGAALISTGFSYDAGARITRKVETLGSQTDIYAYAYDPAGRLAEVRKNGVLQASYQYDPNGNRLARTGASGTTQGTYDAQDRLLSYGANTYRYTDNGELASKTVGAQTTRYSYDVLGNLRQVALPNGTAIEYLIDGRNRRVGKQVNGVRVQGFLYQDQLKPIAELDGSGTVVSRFVYATGINVPDYMVRGGVTYRIVTDHLGSPRLVVDTVTGAIAQRLDFDEFGNVTHDSHPGFQPFGFAGGIYDRDTRLVRFGARDYDAETGRWTAKDPIRFAGGDTNLYVYVAGDPINWIDPLGLRGLRPAFRQPPNHYSYQNGQWVGVARPPGPQPAARNLTFTSNHADRASVTVQTAIWRTVENKWWPASEYEDLQESQIVGSCAVIVCGIGVDQSSANSCPAPGSTLPIMHATGESPISCRCL